MQENSGEKPKLNLPLKQVKIKPLTREQIHETAVERVHLISKEFTDGFNFLQKYPKSVTFFGGSHFKEDDKYYKEARELSTRIVKELGYSIVTGGGPGIMEAANRGAFESGGQSIGLTIELPQHQIQNLYLNDNLNFHYFFSRKVCLGFSAEAYVYFPGGFGTFDELFEMLTLTQTNKIERVPMILFGSDFWKPVDELIKRELLSRETIDSEDAEIYTITDDMNEVLRVIQEVPVRNGVELKYDIKQV